MSSLYYHQQQHQQEHTNTNTNNDQDNDTPNTRTQPLTRIRTQTLNRTQNQDDVGQAALEKKNLTMTATATATAAAAAATTAAIEQQLRFNHEEAEQQQHQTQQQALASSNFAMAAVAAEQQLRLNYEQQKQQQQQVQQQVQTQTQVQERNLAMADAAAAEQLRFDHEEQQQQAHAHAQAQHQQQQQLRIVVVEHDQEEEYHSNKSSRVVLQELPPQEVMEGTQHQQYRAYHAHAHRHENQSHHQAAVQPPFDAQPLSVQLLVVVNDDDDDKLQSEPLPPPQHYIQSRDEIFDILESMMVQETSRGGYDIESYFPHDYDRERIHSSTPRQQNAIHTEWRSKICQWLYTVVDHYEMTRELVVISLSYFDRFMASMSSKEGGVPAQLIDGRVNADGTSSSISSNDLALLTSLTVLYVATKLHLSNNMGYDSLHRPLQCPLQTNLYHNVPSLKQLADMSRGRSKGSPEGFGVSSILAMEKVLLEQLQWKLHPPTLHSFISLLIQLIPTSSSDGSDVLMNNQQKKKNKQILDELYSTSIFIAELGICDPFFIQNNIPPSIQAFASICICMDDILSHTKYQRDQFVDSICQCLGLCHISLHQHMFHQSCIRLCAVYLEHQQHGEERHQQEQEQQVVDPYTAAAAAANSSTTSTAPVAAPPDADRQHQRRPSYNNSNSSNSVTSSPTSTATYMPSSPTCSTTDMMSLSTMNSAMMAHSIADTLTTVGDYCGRSTTMMTSVKRNDSLFSSSMHGSMGAGHDDNDNGNNGSGGDTAAVNVTRDDSMVSTVTIGLTRGESMVSSMSGCGGPVASATFARGESMVSSISGNGNGNGTRTATPFEDDDDVNNDMLRYSPSPPQLDYYSQDDY